MLRELFENNKNIIINNDIDGILSGALLVKYLDCRVVGFTNSKDKVWLAEGFDDLYAHVYVDMFVTDARALCVDQHIVAVNEQHQNQIIQSKSKYGPQIDGDRVFTDYGFANKYPFGTVQYLVAQLESEGVAIELPAMLQTIPNSSICFGDLIQRADDAMNTTLSSQYMRNASYWWNWLLERSGNGAATTSLYNYLVTIKSEVTSQINADGCQHRANEYKNRLKDVVAIKKENTRRFFADNFLCRHSDGDFKEIIDSEGSILPNFLNYIQTCFKIINGEETKIPKHYIVHKGVYCRTRWLDIFEEDFLQDYTICGHKVFSYAFIYGPKNDSTTNFSFTIDMK